MEIHPDGVDRIIFSGKGIFLKEGRHIHVVLLFFYDHNTQSILAKSLEAGYLLIDAFPGVFPPIF
jgi:hypothetical protein